MTSSLDNIINLSKHPLASDDYLMQCKSTLDLHGVLVLPKILNQKVVAEIQKEGEARKHLAYYTDRKHNIYLSKSDLNFPVDHPRNREVTSSKGCITTDQIPETSALHTLYESSEFKAFLCTVLGEKELHAYADPMSSINLHYASDGQELGWHFDNSSFAITLMIQAPDNGGEFEYVKDVRNADAGEMNYDQSGEVLDGEIPTETITMDAGTLVLFRGRNSMHRVTPVIGDTTRMLVVLAYNTEPGIALSKSAMMTFMGAWFKQSTPIA